VVYNTIHIYSKRNAYEMPAYHRFDIGMFYYRIKPKGTSKWSVSIYNLYNRKNAYYLFFKESDDGTLKLYQKSLFPILINIGYLYSFSVNPH